MFLILLILSILFLFVGAIQLTNATVGVGIICVACVFAIFSRIAQAKEYQKELIERFNSDK